MMIEHTIPAEEVWKYTDPVMEKITDEVAEKIKELNGGKSLSARSSSWEAAERFTTSARALRKNLG